MNRRYFLKLTGSVLLLMGSGLSWADRRLTSTSLVDLANKDTNRLVENLSKRHWNDPYTREEISHFKRAARWCYSNGNRLISL